MFLNVLLRFQKDCGLLTVNIEAPFLGPTGSTFKDGDCQGDFRFEQLMIDSNSTVASQALREQH